MLYERQFRNKKAFRVQIKPDVEFSFLAPTNEHEYLWWKYCLLRWLGITPISVLKAISAHKSLKAKLCLSRSQQYKEWKTISHPEKIIAKETAYYTQLENTGTTARLDAIWGNDHNYVSPFEKYASTLDKELEPFLTPYKTFDCSCSLDSSILDYLLDYARKQVNNFPNSLDWSEGKRKTVREILEKIVRSEVTANDKFCAPIYDGMDIVQVRKSRNVIHNVLEEAQHALIWIAFKSQQVPSSVRIPRKGQESQVVMGYIRFLPDITSEVVDKVFSDWRRHITFNRGKLVRKEKGATSDRNIRRDIQFIKRVQAFHNQMTNLQSYRFVSSTDSSLRQRPRQVMRPEEVCQMFEIMRDWKNEKPNRVTVQQQFFVEACIAMLLSTGFRQNELIGFNVIESNGKQMVNLERFAVKTPAGVRKQEVTKSTERAIPIIRTRLLEWSVSYTPFVHLQTFFKIHVSKIGHTPSFTPHDLRATAIAYYGRFYPTNVNQV